MPLYADLHADPPRIAIAKELLLAAVWALSLSGLALLAFARVS